MKSLHVAASLLVVSIVGLTGCGDCRNSPTRIVADSAGWDSFGEPWSGGATGISLDLLVAYPARFDGDTFLVRGATVDSVSKQDGTWFTVRDGGAPVRVTFMNPSYAVPTNCEGRAAMIEGVFVVKSMPEAEAKQALEDAGHHDEALKLVGAQEQLTISATGVRLSH